MSRIFLDDLRAAATALFADNTAGDISPADLRGVMLDTIDSTIEDEGGIYSVTPTLAIPTAVAYAELLNIYTTDVGGDGTFLIPDFTLGTVTTSATAGFSYEVSAQLSFEGANNTQYDFTIMHDGVAVGVGESVTGRGSGRPVGVNITSLSLSTPASAVVTLAVQSPDGVSTIDILKASLFTIIKPTNNP